MDEIQKRFWAPRKTAVIVEPIVDYRKVTLSYDPNYNQEKEVKTNLFLSCFLIYINFFTNLKKV